ncbi:MAG: class I SAM-dependent methyltransferase [Nanoarchaeota archaeon]|nr:class I SAM-dependent methyltransferase [Nanoarchaeota archaeon]
MKSEVRRLKELFKRKEWVEYWLGKPKSFGKVWEKLFNEMIWKEAERLYPLGLKDKKILIVGCGPGAEAEWLIKRGAIVTCSDINEDFLRLAKKRLGDKCEGYFIEDAEKLSFRKDSFDIVYMCGVLHHVPNYKKAISEAKKVAKEGVIIINEPREVPLLKYLMRALDWNTEYEKLETHRFNDDEIENLLKKGGWKVNKSIKWCYFPKMLEHWKDSKFVAEVWLRLMRSLSFFLGYFGHQVNFAAYRT